MSERTPVALIILDGFGLRDDVHGNAVLQAHTPNFDRYWQHYPHTTLTASGLSVGLPDGQMGNSEVGHLNIGAGRIVYQDLTRISKSITDGDFYTNDAFVEVANYVKANTNRALHLCGLLSDGGVHSHLEHLFALLQLCKNEGVERVYVHAFLDGRDVSPDSAMGYMEDTIAKMAELGVGRFATVHGRYYAMDRDKRWERTEKSYRAIVNGDGPRYTDPLQVVRDSYAQSVYDEFIIPAVIVDGDEEPVGIVRSEDAVLFFNFRPDRAIQISQALTNVDFQGFDRGMEHPHRLHFVSMTKYSDTIDSTIAYPPTNLAHTLGDVLSAQGRKQLRIAETEKYPHVTFFFNGGEERELAGEKRVLIPSPKVATYDLKPEMSAYEIAEACVAEIENDTPDCIVLNFANPDMVGHSGMLAPTIRAVEVVDECLGTVVDSVLAHGGVAIITADHGNADMVLDAENRPVTSHTTAPVPLILTQEGQALRDDGILADIAPTLLTLLGIAQPAEMTGKTLIR